MFRDLKMNFAEQAPCFLPMENNVDHSFAAWFPVELVSVHGTHSAAVIQWSSRQAFYTPLYFRHGARLARRQRNLAQRSKELSRLGEWGRPPSSHLDAEGRKHESSVWKVLYWLQSFGAWVLVEKHVPSGGNYKHTTKCLSKWIL